VRGTYRFIEEQQRRVFQDQPRHGETLLLTSANHHTALANHGVVSVRERADCVVHVCALRSLDDLLVARFHVTVFDVVPDGIVE
jgi:rRNA pseudouridine-1189 N-methylase Emg1 (Nep1/Mra1 family)